MKKIFLFLAAASMLAVACNKGESGPDQPQSGAGVQIALQAVSQNTTKGAELSGTQLTQKYSIYAVASQKSSSGLIENSDFFTGEKQFVHNITGGDDNTAVPAETKWRASTPLYWPIGGARMDFLAYAIPTTLHTSDAGKWVAVFDHPSTDISASLTFNAVDTYTNQADVLYAAVQDQTSAANGWDEDTNSAKSVEMKFKHAQALLIFNLKENAKAIEAGFKIDEIAFLSNERVAALRTYQTAKVAYDAKKAAANYDIMSDSEKASWDSANKAPTLATMVDNNVTLKTVGTFNVDNTHVELVPSWSELSSKVASYNMKGGATEVSLANTGTGAPETGKFLDYGFEASSITAGTNYQLGETLLIPQQEKVNFVIKYEMNSKTFYYIHNDLRGIWEMGKKYIYNLDVNLSEIVITEKVVDFDSEVTPVPIS